MTAASRWVPLAALAGLVALWAYYFWSSFAQYGLFNRLGDDFSYYWAQSRVLQMSSSPRSIYDVASLRVALAPLTAYIRFDAPEAISVGAVPYPPLFAWLFTPFTFGSPLVAFAFYTALNMVLAIVLAVRASTSLQPRKRLLVIGLTLTSFPVIFTLYSGQPVLWLALGVGEWLFAMRAGHDFRAGLWLTLLFFKPQYAFLIVPLLFWKRRWKTVAGACVGGLVVLAASVLVSDWETAILSYPRVLLDFGGAVLRTPLCSRPIWQTGAH